jgi:alpha-tubulin suppressor-like RCC1 family protein
MGEASGCAIDRQGEIDCWGLVSTLGSSPGGSFESVVCGKGHCCALDIDGAIDCWGNDADGATSPPNGGFKQVSCGSLHCCGINLDGVPVCWGSNNDADGVRIGQATPP